jgi:uncharacterized protein
MALRRIVLDVLVPHEPSVLAYAKRLGEMEGTEGVTVHVLEQDEQTKTIEVTIEGADLSFDAIKSMIGELGGAVHSIDQVSVGSRIVTARSLSGRQA